MKAISVNRGLSVMTYSHDGFGLGHMKRNYSIACRGVRSFPDSKFLMITGSPSSPFFHMPDGVDFIKLPSIIKVEDGEWSSRTLSMDHEKFRELRIAIILDSIRIFKPDVFLVDYIPSGVWGELIPALKELKESEDRPMILLGLRDILDLPEVTRNFWKKEGEYETIKKYYDRVLVYGSRDIFDTAYHYGLGDDIAHKVKYCGYVISDLSSHAEEYYSKRKTEAKSRVRILVTAGGGYDAYPMMKVSMDALRIVYQNTSARSLFITGPLMDRDDQNSLKDQAGDLPFRIMRSGNPSEYMHFVDLIITMGGYNTLMDSLIMKKNIIVIPREGPSSEQKLRADIFSKKGLIKTFGPPGDINPSELADTIYEMLGSSPSPPLSTLDMNGLDNVMREINSLVSERMQEKISIEKTPRL